MRRNILLVLCLFFTVCTYGQCLVCTNGLVENPSDLSPRTGKRLDVNGEPAAVIRVNSMISGLSFVSNYILGEVSYQAGQYVIYIAQGAKSFEVRKEGYLPCKIVFSDKSDVTCVQKGTAYMMEIGETTGFGRLDIKSEPSNAEVSVDGEYYGTTPLDSNYTLIPVGPHKITVSKKRHRSEEFYLIVKADETYTRTIKLSPTMAFLHIETNFCVDVYIDGNKVSTGNYDKFISVGEHVFLFKVKHDYVTYQKSCLIEVDRITKISCNFNFKECIWTLEITNPDM